MHTNSLVHALWDGAIGVASGPDARRFKSLISLILPVDVALLRIDADRAQPTAMCEDTPVLDDFVLGDVLAEELDIDVAPGAVVVVRREGALRNVSREVGVAVGEILVALAERGALPVADEGRILEGLAARAHARAAETDLARAGLCVADFRAGLRRALRGVCRVTSTPELRNLPEPAGRLTFNAWMGQVRTAFLSDETSRRSVVRDLGFS